MTIRVALHHKTLYRFDRTVTLSPHEIRLKPAAHARTPILSYSLQIQPAQHFINWQQDAQGNFIARLTFPEPTRSLEVTVDLIADMTVINPFDFFLESYAEQFPFFYPKPLAIELAPYLVPVPGGRKFDAWLRDFRKNLPPKINTNDFLVRINQQVQSAVGYLIRMEPGVQTPEETLAKGSGSCRDSAWLLVQLLRRMGIAARFVSGYLIQLAPDEKPLDGPAGPSADFTDLHAWCEAYIPGAGWIGLDATSGLLAGEGHIPLVAAPQPASASPISGMTDVCETEFSVEMTVTRVHEDPRVTKPYTDLQWEAVQALGAQVDTELEAGNVRLTQGGEPTFVSIDDMESPQWNTAALGEHKWRLANDLMQRLQSRFAPGGLMHFGQGKWYPGEPLPRWALTAYWRADGVPIWSETALMIGDPGPGTSRISAKTLATFGHQLAEALHLDPAFLITAYEDPWLAIHGESLQPINLDSLDADLNVADERRTLAKTLRAGLGAVGGYVLPLKSFLDDASGAVRWQSSVWPLRTDRLYLLPGDSPMGFRLPLNSLPWVAPELRDPEVPVDPFAERLPLSERERRAAQPQPRVVQTRDETAPHEVIHTALALEVREGMLQVFLPPVPTLEAWLDLISAIERCAKAMKQPVRIEGYPPPRDDRLKSLSVTPDPGVIEVNIHPSPNWPTLEQRMRDLYEDARQSRLGAEKFMLDGRHTGTGGGNHVTLGGATAADSPFLRRPDLLKSLLIYWQQHPALSYLFSGQFIGPTSQAPRVDEARDDALGELEIALQQLGRAFSPGVESSQPWLIDRLLRHLLVDLTGNTHRAEFCIDKLYSPDSASGRLGLIEFRAFEMPPHYRMNLVQSLLLRALVARFWQTPYRGKLVDWGTALHDRFMLPHFIEQDMQDICRDLRSAGYAFDDAWFAPFLAFRFPRYGTVAYEGVSLEVRQAIEPWHVLGEEMGGGGTARYVDSSVERVQIKVTGMTGNRHQVACNGRLVPLHPTGVPGEYVAGVRFKAWAPYSALHPTIGVQAPLTFDLLDSWNGRAIGGCTYHVSHPGGRSYDTFPVNANEAEARRRSRFWDHGHTPGPFFVPLEPTNPRFPLTLDLRWQPE
ncbi:IMP dehydrogenase [Halothiobacillus diazotrophicus]|uniref:IMP dehydrogenase n=1 Tax=Halothiobacillus diazotrophicus TaxID=1860122 RepID=A0A191ZDQ6_9GAMM|nr:transglutaminase family protein [Halothiobacillus diazotrophicus]ANJ66001.1 IMP dehydrogenase [Halothiobacillus diazotrophicus]